MTTIEKIKRGIETVVERLRSKGLCALGFHEYEQSVPTRDYASPHYVPAGSPLQESYQIRNMKCMHCGHISWQRRDSFKGEYGRWRNIKEM